MNAEIKSKIMIKNRPAGAVPLLIVILLLILIRFVSAQETNSAPSPIDLATTLKLAGAQNLDVAIARERVKEAQAQHEQARMQFLPWLAPGIGYRRHEGNIQDVSGNVFNADKQSFTAGAALSAQVDVGDAIYKTLAARQVVRAAEAGAETQRQQTLATAAAGYFELARAKAACVATREAVRISEDYLAQVQQAVAVGIAFKGDAYRAEVQMQKNRMLERSAEEQQAVASARLAQTLRLDATTRLNPDATELVPLVWVETNATLSALLARALQARPELKQGAALVAAGKAVRKGAQYGPLVPTLGAQANWYSLSGGKNSDWSGADDGRDYFVGLNWRVGPGGLFDRGRIRAATARETVSSLELDKSRDEIIRQVIESKTRADSLSDQVAMAQRALAAAQEVWKLSVERKSFGLGAVLEKIGRAHV